MISIFLFFSCECKETENIEPPYEKPVWTVLMYSGADNNLESVLLADMSEVKKAYNGTVNILVCIDRNSGYSNSTYPFGTDFAGLKVFSLTRDGFVEMKNAAFIPVLVSDHNSGNADMLKGFIDYGKKKYPDTKYALFIGSHGQGSRSSDSSVVVKNENLVQDQTSNDWILTSEFTEKMGSEQSVDLLAIDACFMGNIEFIYQLRKGNNSFCADYIVASPPEIRSEGWNYTDIFSRIKIGTDVTNDNERIVYGQSTLSALDFALIIFEEFYDKVITQTSRNQVITIYDTQKALDVKNNCDDLSKLLVNHKVDLKSIRGSGSILQSEIIHYFKSADLSHSIAYPYFDLYDLCDKIQQKKTTFSEDVVAKALLVMQSIDMFIIDSAGDDDFSPYFKNGKNGVSIFFPEGDVFDKGKLRWNEYIWYNDNLAWCKDNAVSGDGKVDNWFELLDCWFDSTTDSTGGLNTYSF